jgi:hypothetical protein
VTSTDRKPGESQALMTTVRRRRGSFVAEGLELSDLAAGAEFGVDTAGRVVRAEVVVAGGGVGE